MNEAAAFDSLSLTAASALQVFACLRTPVWIYDFDSSHVVWGNPAACRYWGVRDLRELIARTVEPTSPSLRHQVALYREALSRGETVEDSWYFHLAVFPRIGRFRLSPFELPDKRLGGIVEIIQAPEFRAPQDALRAIESHRHSSTLTLMVAPDGRVLLSNPAALVALPKLRLSGACWQHLFEDAVMAQSLLDGVLLGETHEIELAFETNGQSTSYLANLKLGRDPMSGDSCIVISLTDVSERKQLEQRIRESEASVRLAMELAPVALVILSAFGQRALYANAAALKLLAISTGKRREQMNSLMTLNSPLIRTILGHLRASRSYGPEEFRLTLDESQQLSIRVSGESLVYDGEAAIILSLENVDDLRRAEIKLATALEREQDANRLHKQLVSLVSHELKTPLSIVDSGLQRILRHYRDWPDEQVENKLQALREGLGRLSRLTERLLDSGRLDDGRVDFRPANIRLSGVFEKLRRSLRVVGPDPIQLHIAPDADQLSADPELLGQVFANLIDNAIKYSAQGSPVSIHAERVDDTIVVRIRDQGPGIPADELPHVFERFFRASTTLNIRGTGLGFSITRQLVELHKGAIEISSEPGVGTEVTLRLPVVQENGAPA